MATAKTSKKATIAKAPKDAEEKVTVNGCYDYLVRHFEKPSTIIDAAVALGKEEGIDAQIAAKNVETFLENAKIDQTLEVRAGTGKNEGQFVITRVPQNAQKEVRTVKAKAVKKADTLHLKVTEGTLRTGNRRGAAIQFWSTGFHSVESAVTHLAKQFPNQPEKALRSAATEIFRNTGLRDRLKVKVVKKEHGDTTHYTVVAA